MGGGALPASATDAPARAFARVVYEAVVSARKNSENRARDTTPEVEMTRKELLSRISIDPEICFGKPCIRGHRIWVSLVLDMLSSGWSVSRLLDEYPGLEEADVLACIAYGAEMSRERYVEVAVGATS